MKHRRLNWNRPLLPAVCEDLLERATGPVTDLSHIWIILPTEQAGRRLGECLARAAGPALLPPLTGTPEHLLGKPGEDVADESDLVAAWGEVLDTADLSAHPHVFPRAPEREPLWTLGMALRLTRLQAVLGEEGLDFEAVAAAVADTPCEPARWRELARLENNLRRALGARSLTDPHLARRRFIAAPVLPRGIREIVLAGVADPLPLALRSLEAIAVEHPVEIWTYGPGEAEAFDAFGRPAVAYWNSRELALEAPQVCLHNPPGPEQAAALLAERVVGRAVEAVAVGLPDPTLTAPAAKALDDVGTASFDPAGQPLNRGGVGGLADLFCRFAAESGTDLVRELLRHPDVWSWLQSTGAPGEETQAGLLRLLDRLEADHLPAGLDDLTGFAGDPLRASLRALSGLRGSFATRGPAAGLREVLRQVYRGRSVDPANEHDAAWIERAETLDRILERAELSESRFPETGGAFHLSSLRQAIGRAAAHLERPHRAHDLLGWLELLWTDAPDLVVAGLNEGLVPEAINGDAFLPDQVRETLGLRTNAWRFARDAYLLAATCQWRVRAGARIDLIVPQSAPDGSPLKPSRLLFLCQDDALPGRVRQVFTPPAAPDRRARRSAFPLLRPPPAPRPAHLSISDLNAWLGCPFRFCLGRILGMRPLHAGQREMDPLLFGTVLHAAVEDLRGAVFDRRTDPAELAGRLEARLDREMERRFGRRLSFALRLQREALAARLRAFAHRQAESVEHDGAFTVEEVERKIEFEVGGVPLCGRIDRTDRMESGGLRLIDYKSGDTARTPKQAHLRKVGGQGRPPWLPDEAFVEIDGKEYAWTNLQLPLYVEALRREGEPARAAYFNLPKSREKAGLEDFAELTSALLESAVACAAAVVREVRAGHFWPPNLDLREDYDDFAPLFPDGIGAAVEAEDFAAFTFLTEEDAS